MRGQEPFCQPPAGKRAVDTDMPLSCYAGSGDLLTRE